ncbi:MAG: GntR family transcriptional regulator, partial [Bryobacteraceae bacterium]
MTRNGERRSLSETAYTYVRERILSGGYPLGFPLSRRKVAEELGVSLVPVAEALNRLEAEGLVESQPRAGTRVRIPSVQEIRGHYLVREALESQAARLFAQMAGQPEKQELRRLAAQLDALSVRLL